VPKSGRKSIGLLIGCSMLAITATAQSSPSRDAYDAFQADNYELALEHLMHVYTNLQHSPAGPASGRQAERGRNVRSSIRSRSGRKTRRR
jgi:hypothetical protein